MITTESHDTGRCPLNIFFLSDLVVLFSHPYVRNGLSEVVRVCIFMSEEKGVCLLQ